MATALQLGDFELIRQGGPLLYEAAELADGRRKDLLELAVMAFEANEDPVTTVIAELNPEVDSQAISEVVSSSTLVQEVRTELDAALSLNRMELEKLYQARNQSLQEAVSAQLGQLKADLLESGALQQVVSKVVGEVLEEKIQQRLEARLLGAENGIDAIEETLEEKLPGLAQSLKDYSEAIQNRLVELDQALEDFNLSIEGIEDRLAETATESTSQAGLAAVQQELQSFRELTQVLFDQLEAVLGGASVSIAIENISDRLNQLAQQGEITQQKTLELSQAIAAVQQQIAATTNLEELFQTLQASINQAAAQAAAQAEAQAAQASGQPVVTSRLSGLVDLRSTPLSELGLRSYELFTLSAGTAHNSDFWIGQDPQLGLQITRQRHGWDGAFTLSNVGGDPARTFEMIVGYHWQSHGASKEERVQALPGLIDYRANLSWLQDTSILKLIHLGQWLDGEAKDPHTARGFKSVYWKAPASRREYGSQDPIAGTDLKLESGDWAKLSYGRGGQAGGRCRLVAVTGAGTDPFAASEETGEPLEWVSANPNQISRSLVFCFPVYRTVNGELRVLAVKVT